jgi:hypothetical protein
MRICDMTQGAAKTSDSCLSPWPAIFCRAPARDVICAGSQHARGYLHGGETANARWARNLSGSIERAAIGHEVRSPRARPSPQGKEVNVMEVKKYTPPVVETVDTEQTPELDITCIEHH